MEQRFTLLGTLKIEQDGQLSPVMSSQKGCALLAYLILKQQPQSRESVADLLWESTTTSQSLTRLRTLLSRIRKWVPELVVTRRSLQFRATTQTSVDLYALNEALATDDVNQLDQALASLYEGDLLQGFIVEDAPHFSEWLLLARERVRQQVVTAYQKLCRTYADQEQWEQGIAVSRRWLLLDDFDEEAVRWLMQFLGGGGQVGAALQEYENLRQQLWQELEAEPEAATADLAKHLATQPSKSSWSDVVPVPNWQAAPLPQPGELSPPGLLPPQVYLPYHRNDDFQGREDALLWLADQILPWPDKDSKPGRIAAAVGMGGLGKTQLAVEFCYRYGRYYEGGVYWLSFADADNAAAEIAMIGGERGMGLYREADKLTQVDQISRVQRAWQEATPRLLIFDNCEEEELLNQWLPVTGGCHILLTSRRDQWTPELRVAVLALHTLNRAESVALLAQLAPGAVAEGRSPLQEIATELGDLPLALHLAGSFLHRYRHITPAAYLDQLHHLGHLQHPSLRGHGISHSPTGHELHVARTFAINSAQLEGDDPLNVIARQLLAHAACFGTWRSSTTLLAARNRTSP